MNSLINNFVSAVNKPFSPNWRQCSEVAYKEAEKLIESKNYEQGLPALFKLASNGDKKAGEKLCAMQIDKEHSQRVFDYYSQQAAYNTCSYSVFMLGESYFWGICANASMSDAISCWERAAELGSCDALCRLGALYYDGIHVTQNYAKAMSFYEKADELNSQMAAFSLGVMYENGYGVAKSVFMAHYYLGRADLDKYSLQSILNCRLANRS